jgi:hypothetical protein
MKNKFSALLTISTLAVASTLSISAMAQTTDEGSGPSEQPSAPMEIGQAQPPVNVQESNIPPNGQADAQSSDSQGDQGTPADEQSPNANQDQPQEAQPGGPQGEAPAQTDLGVARVSLIHGDVSTQRGDSGDWSAATLNQPVMGGDKVSTGDDARTELQLDFANILRVGPNSKANIATLTQKDIQIQVGEGIVDYVLSKDSEAEPEIDTPNVAVHPAHHDGVFRIEVRPNGDTVVIVRQGEAQLATPQGSTEVHSGEMATIRGAADSAQYKISDAPDRDDWDQWNSDRDHLIRDAKSWSHTNRRYTGTQDLDAYGQWQNVPDYGDVWVPNEPDGWAPYRDGNWTYEPYYGWTWVGYEPWGWAPYHYGRWFWYGNSWAWWPGPVWAGYDPFWSPAYVSFWGWGGGLGFGVGFGWGGWGDFGWMPIGPCDWFHPWWGGYRGRFGVFGGRGGYGYGHFGGWGRYGGFAPLHGGTRFSNIANMRNNHVLAGMSTVGAGHFGTGTMRPVAVTRTQFNGARMMAGNLPVVPTHASLSASGRPAAASTMRGGGAQHFFGSMHPNASHPQSFQQQTASLRQTMQTNHVSAFSAGSRPGTFANRGGNAAGVQRPNSGSFANRGVSNSGTRTASNVGNRGTQSFANHGGTNSGAAPNGGRGAGFRPFTPPRSSNARSAGSSYGTMSRGFGQPGSSTGRNGFRPFTPPSPGNQGFRSGQPTGRSNGTSYWNRTAPSSGSRGYGSGNYGYGGFSRGAGSRPQLDMRQPIARSPSYGGYGRSSYGGGYSRPSYGGGGYSHPSYGAPRGYSGGGGRSYGGGGGHYSGGGGGHFGGGGGGHAGGGGGHGGGGHR